jgi:type IV pilus assembly protein PilB
MTEHPSLGERLVAEGHLTAEQLRTAMREEEQGRAPLHKALVARGWVPADVVAMHLAEVIGLPYIRLSDFTVDAEILKVVPEDLCRRHRIFPLFRIGDTLTVAMADPSDVVALDQAKRASGLEVDAAVTTETEIVQTLDHYYGARSSIAELIKGIDFRGLGLDDARGVSPERLAKVGEVAPVVKLVSTVIASAVIERASDVHIEPDAEALRVRFRVDGVLREAVALPKHLQPAVVSRIKILSDLDIADSRLPKDGRFRFTAEEHEVDVRVSTFPTIYGENVVLRILDKGGGLMRLEDLGFGAGMLAQYRRVIARPYGLILVTGPTGSGKTTTLYATLAILNTAEKNIITIEDPVEYNLPMVRQSQVNPKAGLTFASGIRSILRQDPDIIMVGEVRDLETAQTAVQAALTGHLVLTTLHTNDAVGAITRLLDMGVEPFLIASAVIGTMAQRLVRTICPRCKEGYAVSPQLRSQLGIRGETAPLTFFRGRGCHFCREAGYRGRVGIYEFLTMSDPLRELVLARASATDLKQAAIQGGMQDLRFDGFRKAAQGVTSIEEILRATQGDGG